MTRLENRTALVTGSARGIGRAIAERLGRDGAHVVVTDLRDGTATVDAIEAAGGSAEFREGDVTSQADLERVMEGLELDVLVNNAAYYAALSGPEAKQRFDEIDEAEWDTVMAVNVKGPFLASKAALPRFEDGGSIVHLSSDTVLTGVPGFLHYVTSKAALIGLTRSMATELGDLDIRVNAVMPGLTASETVLSAGESLFDPIVAAQAFNRRIQPEDIANVVAFLAGPDSEIVTGQVIPANAGKAFH